jgi:transcriptional regulator with XRE-family HTH domain
MNTKIADLLKDPEFQKIYAVEGLLADAAELIWQLLVQRKMKQTDLARLLNKTPAFVSQLLNGKANMTVRTLAEVASALGATIKIEAVDTNANAGAPQECPHVHTFKLPAKSVSNENAFRLKYVESGVTIDTDDTEGAAVGGRSMYAA